MDIRGLPCAKTSMSEPSSSISANWSTCCASVAAGAGAAAASSSSSRTSASASTCCPSVCSRLRRSSDPSADADGCSLRSRARMSRGDDASAASSSSSPSSSSVSASASTWASTLGSSSTARAPRGSSGAAGSARLGQLGRRQRARIGPGGRRGPRPPGATRGSSAGSRGPSARGVHRRRLLLPQAIQNIARRRVGRRIGRRRRRRRWRRFARRRPVRVEGLPPPGVRTRWERGEPGLFRRPRGASGGDTGTDSALTRTAGGEGRLAAMPETHAHLTGARSRSRLVRIHRGSVLMNSRTADQALRQPAAAAAIFRGGRVGDLSASTTSRNIFGVHGRRAEEARPRHRRLLRVRVGPRPPGCFRLPVQRLFVLWRFLDEHGAALPEGALPVAPPPQNCLLHAF